MNEPLISTVIPAYNYGRFLADALDSALAQTYPHQEIIVVDDGSTDDTRERIEPYLDRIRYIHQENGGLSAARNTGIRAASGEWIALLDADDAWHPRKLEVQVRCLQRLPEEVGLLATGQFEDQRPSWPAVNDTGVDVITYSLEDVLGMASFGPSSALIRKKCLEEVGRFDPALRSVEDRDMWIRLAARCTLAKLPLPLLFYRVHGAGLSNRCLQMERYEQQVLAKAFAQIPALRGRWLLRRKTYGQAAFASGQVFRCNGCKGAALARMLRSFLIWPLPMRVKMEGGFCLRPRIFLNLLLRTLKLRADEPAVSDRAIPQPPPIPGRTQKAAMMQTVP